MAFRRTRFAATFAAGVLLAGLLLAAPAFAAAPTITSFTPTSGPLGTTITITGTNFAAPATVKVNGVAATAVTVVSSTRITARVTAAATTGKITVAAPGGTATSTGTFTVTPGAVLVPGSGPPGTSTALSLSGFGAGEAVDVYVDTTDTALVIASAAGQVSTHVTIPAAATPGSHTVTAVGRRTSDAAQSSFLVRTDWPQRGFSLASTGTNPYENVLSPATVGHLTAQWRYNLGSTCIEDSPAIVAGVVYFADCSGFLYAVTAATGAVRWSEQLADSVSGYSSPAVAAGVLYVGVGDNLIAVTAATGGVRWAFEDPSGDFDSSPRVVAGVVYTGNEDGKVYAVNPSGRELWSTDVGHGVFTAPTYANGYLYVTTETGHLVKIVAATGAIGFDQVVDTGVFLSGSPVVADGLVYAAGTDLTAYDANTGSQVWTQPLDSESAGTPALDDGTMFVSDDTGTAYAFDAGDGTPEWSRSVSMTALIAPVQAADGVVYVGNTATYALAESNGVRLRTLPSGAGFGGPAITDGTVTVGATNPAGTFAMVRYALPSGSQAVNRSIPDPAQLHPDRHLEAKD